MKNAVIANQCAHWCGNPPDRGEMYRKAPGKTGIVRVLGGNRYLVPWGRGIATTTAPAGASRAQPPKAALSAEECAHWSRNDR